MESVDIILKKNLRSGYTTGACAAAAAKAAVLLLGGKAGKGKSGKDVEIPFPDGSRVVFRIENSELETRGSELTARASIIKDAGDDPDVTNGAEIVAEAALVHVGARRALPSSQRITIKGGTGVGTVTKPGLSVPVGEPAINPVPRKMIEAAVSEVLDTCRGNSRITPAIEITISVPKGEELAKKTLNYRLGIEGGISILGTTGIVKPVSTEAWTATITSSMDVATAMGHEEIVLSAGRTSEKAHMEKFRFPEEAYVLMGDYLEYSLQEAARHTFKKIHLCAQWAKMVKIAMATPQTHVRFGAINVRKAVELLNSLGIDVPQDRDFNTAREIFDYIYSRSSAQEINVSLQRICNAAKKYAEEITQGIPVVTCLVSYEREIISTSE